MENFSSDIHASQKSADLELRELGKMKILHGVKTPRTALLLWTPGQVQGNVSVIMQ